MTPSQPEPLTVRPATEGDVPLVLSFIRELAEYEKLSQEVLADEAVLRESLFGPRPAAEVLLGFAGEEPAAFAVYFHNFSTFTGRPGLYLEDLFVQPRFRGRGYGRALLERLAAVAVDRGCPRFEWAVLDWNEPALGFYRRLGARALEDWVVHRVTGDTLRRLAAGEAAQ